MFTGIITDIGKIHDIDLTPGHDTRLVIATSYAPASIDMGASIACNGCCLTVIDKGTANHGNWFAVEASQETLDCTTLGTWAPGSPVNLERALKVGDELGGHIVSGHVDGVGEVVAIDAVDDSKRFRFRAPRALIRFIAEKGSVAVDGISLTVNKVDGDLFDINIIPHTQQKTTLGAAAPGTPVNLEIDMLARYVARLKDFDND